MLANEQVGQIKANWPARRQNDAIYRRPLPFLRIGRRAWHRLQEVPDRLELLAGVAIEDVFDLRGPTIDGELGHASRHVVARRIEREAAKKIMADAFACQREVDARREQRALVAGRR